jgi:hypothetical protein
VKELKDERMEEQRDREIKELKDERIKEHIDDMRE